MAEYPILRRGMPTDDPGPLLTHTATPEEMARYGIRPPLRADLVKAIEDGLGLQEIAQLYGITELDVAGKIVAGGKGLRDALSPAGLEQLNRMSAAVWKLLAPARQASEPETDEEPVDQEELTEAVPDLEPEADEGDDDDEETDGEESGEAVARRKNEELRRRITPEVISRELETSTIKQAAKNLGIPQTTLETLMREYDISVTGVRELASLARTLSEGAKTTDAAAAPVEVRKQEPTGPEPAIRFAGAFNAEEVDPLIREDARAAGLIKPERAKPGPVASPDGKAPAVLPARFSMRARYHKLVDGMLDELPLIEEGMSDEKIDDWTDLMGRILRRVFKVPA